MSRQRWTLVAAVVLASALPGCRQAATRVGGPYYFETADVHFAPAHVFEPLSASETQGRAVYYEAHFDVQGRLLRVTKFWRQNLEHVYEYTYDSAGALSRETSYGSSGPKRMLEFRGGRMVAERHE